VTRDFALQSEMTLSKADRRFLAKVSRTLIPPSARDVVDVDVVANIDRMLSRANARHRANVLRLVRWTRRLSIFYGGASMPARAGRSRVISIQRLARALTSLCLVAFWGDEQARTLIDEPGGPR
jgi:hypothetical protein